MADERDPKVSRTYRELGAEEPPRALDEAILAASRRAAKSHPAPLVAPAGRRRWYFPLAAAAVIMLAVAVTLQIERQKPDDELVVASTSSQAQKEEQQALKTPASPEQPKPAPKPMRAPQPFTPEPLPAAQAPQAVDAVRELSKQAEVGAAAQGARPNEPQPEARARSDVMRDRASSASASPRAEGPAPQAKPMPNLSQYGVVAGVQLTPERWLEQIAELRKQGKHEAADKALADFRKQYPDYRMSDQMRAKVEKK